MAYHTFSFYWKRRHDPKWQLDYQIAFWSRIRNVLIAANLVVYAMIFFG
jgi:endo-alpha-1,4-polygalactosaminidase (GH114 family)